MELEVGMYVRTIQNSAVGNGVIGKIKYINYEDRTGKHKNYYSVWTDNKSWFELTDNDFKNGRAIAKHNPINLIKVGDYVNESLIAMTTVKSGGNCVIASNGLAFNNDDIKSIVTKEQFASISYKLGKED